MVHQVRGAFRHATPATARAKSSALTRKGHQAIDATPSTPKASEAGGQTTTAQEVSKLLLDESR